MIKEKKLPSLNGLRAISIFLVLFDHLQIKYYIFSETLPKYFLPIRYFLEDGHLGVNVFFVISGFLITTLLLKEEQKNKTVSLKKFYIRRTLRIFPAYYTLLLVYFILQCFGYLTLSNYSWLSSVTYTKYFNWYLDWYTAHGWSLSIEEHFYLFWPLLFIIGNEFRKKASIVLFLVVPLIRIYNYYHPGSFTNGEQTIFTCMDALAIGCICALNKTIILERFSNLLKPMFYVSVILLTLFHYFMVLFNKAQLGIVFIVFGATHGTIANLFIAIIMMYSVYISKGIWYKFLNNKVINYIGVLSYSIYLWQQFFICKTNFWVNKFPVNLLLLVIVALSSYWLIEKPFLKLKEKFTVN